jgi:hypothetical protein
MSLPLLVSAAAETSTEGSHLTPYVVGAVAFLALVALLMGVLMFGRGRDHS